MLLKLWNEGKSGTYKSTGRTFRKAYMPFVTKLATMLLELGRKNPEVAALLKSEAEWEPYINGEYKATLASESKQLGGAPEEKNTEDAVFNPGIIPDTTGCEAEMYHFKMITLCYRDEDEKNKDVVLQPPVNEENQQAKTETEAEKKPIEFEEVTSVTVAAEKPKAAEDVAVESPLQSEYAANNFWRQTPDMAELNKLEQDYA